MAPTYLTNKDTQSVFPSNWLWCLNLFCSGLLKHWCYVAYQPAFPPVLSRITVIKDMSSTKGVVQYKGTCKTYFYYFGSHGKPAIFRFQLGNNFLGSKIITFYSKRSEWFKTRGANLNRACFMLVEMSLECCSCTAAKI